MSRDNAEPAGHTAATTRTPPTHATRDNRTNTHQSRASTKNSRTKAPRDTYPSVSGRMLLSSEFLLTKNSHKTPSEARSTQEHAPTSSTQHAKHANTASHNPNKHHICIALHLLPACCHQHCMACLLALQPSGHWTFSSNQPIKQTKAKTKACPRPTRLNVPKPTVYRPLPANTVKQSINARRVGCARLNRATRAEWRRAAAGPSCRRRGALQWEPGVA